MNYRAMMTKDPLEAARESLEQSESELTVELAKADAKLEVYRTAQLGARQAFAVAEMRLMTVKMMMEKLCGECLNVIPLLSQDLTTKSQNHDGKNCISCGLQLDRTSPGRIDLPPEHGSILGRAKDSLKYSKAVAESFEGGYAIDTPARIPRRSRTPDPDEQGNCRHHSRGCLQQRELSLERREKIFIAAKQIRKEAKNRCTEIENAVEQWTLYRTKVNKKLAKVKAANMEMRERVRQSLQTKLEALGGTVPPSQKCIICEERPKEIVFQCGHQCCTQCSGMLSRCHTCRQLISMRIKLFD